MNTDQPTLAVTQADRDAAADAWSVIFNGHRDGEARVMRIGKSDDGAVVQAFARHRTNSEPRPAGGLREALEAGRVVLDGRGTGTYDEAQDAIRKLIDAVLATHSPAPMAGEVERLREALIHADLKIRSYPGADQSDVEFIRVALAAHPSTQEGADRG